VITDPRQWRTISSESFRVYLEQMPLRVGERRVFGHSHVLPAELSPLQLYAWLRARYGRPNGFQTFLRQDSVDNLVQWDFMLEDDTFLIEFIGLNFRTECRLWAFVPFPLPDWAEFDSSLTAALATEAEIIKKSIATFEKWHLFVNPYQRLELVATDLEKRLRRCSAELAELPTLLGLTNEEYVRQMNDLTTKAMEQMTLATVLQSIAPVLGEAAVNLVIYLLAHDEIKEDNRLLEDTFRRNIDVRIKRLSVDCRGFARQIDQGRDEFKEFLRLMGRRNNALHGNIDPKRVVGDPIYFDQRTIPLVEHQKGLPRLYYERLTAGASAGVALQDLRIARSFVEFLFTHLTPSIQPQIRAVAGELHIGYRPDTGKLGMILSRHFLDFRVPCDVPDSDATV
jgi:hypothetical protein